MQHVTQPAPGVYSSPDALVGRLYSGHGRNNRLAEGSPPRNTSFGASLRHTYDYQDGDDDSGGTSGASGLIRPRTTNPRDTMLAEQQQDVLVPRLLHPSGSLGNTSSSLRVDEINSPPRIGTRRRSSGGKRSGGDAGPGGSVATSLPRGGKQGTAEQSSAIGGGMSLSRSLGALGQQGGGGGRSNMMMPVAKLRGDSAPYVGSGGEKTSPKPPLRVGAAWSRGSYPGQKNIRYVVTCRS